MAWGDHRTFVELHAKDRKAETPMATVEWEIRGENPEV
jgi:hypothetical protein